MTGDPGQPDFWLRALQHHHHTLIPDPEETTMTDQFIDREALEARVKDLSGNIAEQTWFLAGVDAAHAQIIANTTTEWGVGMKGYGEPDQYTDSEANARMIAERDSTLTDPLSVYSRRFLYADWISSEETNR